MNDDAELLRSYVEHHSDDVFTAIVHRHIGLVYSTALRRVGRDAHLAEDVTQTVFIDLARKAAGLRDRTSLGGWLYLSARNAAAAAVRRESRRKLRESTAQSMHLADATDSPEPDPSRLRPVLDDAIVQLRDEEREAIVLRFFEKRTFSEIGAALLVSEEAARKRVERALEKLHAVLTRRGVTSTAALLGSALGELGAGPVPSGLAVRIAGQACAQAVAASTIAPLASGLAITAALLGAMLLVGGQHRKNARLEAELAQLRLAPLTLTALHAENRQLAQRIRVAADLRRAAADSPLPPAVLRPPRSAIAPAPAQATVTVEPDGTLRWKLCGGSNGAEPVTLDDFIARLKILQAQSPDGEAKLGIRGFSEFSPLAWVIDEARKSEIKHVVVESAAAPNPNSDASWFGSR